MWYSFLPQAQHFGVKLCWSQLRVLLSIATAMQLPQQRLRCILQSCHPCRVSLHSHHRPSHQEDPRWLHTAKKETVTLGFFPWTLHHLMAQLRLHITHSKAQVTTAVVGRHTSPFHGGETALSGLPHANATPSDSSVPITCLPYYPQQGPWNRSSQTRRWFSCPTFVALTFLGRHKLTSVHLAREVMAGSSLKVQLSKRVAYLERTVKGLFTGA